MLTIVAFKYLYIPVWIDQKPANGKGKSVNSLVFIFQYGQIRNSLLKLAPPANTALYIPVWIDQKLGNQYKHSLIFVTLYSSMDRLETY